MPPRSQQLKVISRVAQTWGEADDRAWLGWIYKETVNYLERLTRAVAEHPEQKVDEASNYARWLNFSGLVKLMKAHPQESPFEVDGYKLEKLQDDLIERCQLIYKGGKMKPNPHISKIDSLEAKMDIVLSHLAKSAQVSEAKEIGNNSY